MHLRDVDVGGPAPRFLEGAPGKITTLYRRDRDTVVRVRDLLRAALPANLSQEDVADRLHLSPRTLHRRLEEEGTHFGAIREALRRDLAIDWLAKRPLVDRDRIALVGASMGGQVALRWALRWA